jgi:exodeoxyribonuclease-3
MTDWAKEAKKSKKKLIILGDFNIAPLEHDVWSHKQLLNVVSHTPAEVERLDALKDSLGWCDLGRHFIKPEEKLYSWWSYRNRDWRKSNRGRRLDHIWVTPGLTPALKSFAIHQDARDWDSPSDHVPVMVDMAL